MIRRICSALMMPSPVVREVAKDHVSALLAAEIQVLPHHLLDHVAVADFRPKDLAAVRRERFVEPEIAHHRGDKGIFVAAVRLRNRSTAAMARISSPSTISPFSSQSRTRSASPSWVNPDLRAAFPHEPLDLLRISAAALGVDVRSVGLVVRDG